METYLECLPCFLNQALGASRMTTPDEGVHQRVMRRVMRRAAQLDFKRSPPEMGAVIHAIIREETGSPDPYRAIKEQSNRFALGLLPTMRRRIQQAPEPFQLAARLAIAGNILDFALLQILDEAFILDTMEDALRRPLAIDHGAELQQAVGQASSILFLADNAGEIVLDRLLLEQMPLERVTLVVRGAPVINDATLADAQVAGLTDLMRVISNGSDIPGTLLSDCDESFQDLFWSSDLVIAKGQGNYESLSHVGRDIFHLLKAKCPVVATDLQCEVGDILLVHRGERRA